MGFSAVVPMSVPGDFLCDGYHEYDVLTFATLGEISGSDNGGYVTKLAMNLPVVSLRLFSFSLAGLDYGVGHLV